MLFGNPTKRGTGIIIYGDYFDLNILYETVHQISKSLENDENFPGQFQTLMNFAYEIRKAYSGKREIKIINNHYDDRSEKVTYFGFKVVWTDILIFVNVLRSYAGYSVSLKNNQAILYRLEEVIEKAMFEFDEKGALLLNRALNNGLMIFDKYIFVLYQAIHIDFVMQKSGKLRFRKILSTLNSYLNSFSELHKKLIGQIEELAKENNSNPLNYEYQEFPDIKW